MFKQAALLVLGAVTGFSFAVIRQEPQPETIAERRDASVLRSSDDDTAAKLTKALLRISELTRQLETEQFASNHPTSGGPPVAVQAPDEFRELIKIAAEKGRTLTIERDTARLLAAGFSMPRIEWIRRRSEELQVKLAQDLHERRRQGLPPQSTHYTTMAYIYDADLDLRYEIGDDEYQRYRQALGRPIGVGVEDVLAGSYAESAGLKRGDQILGYGGKRVFNSAELDGLAADIKQTGYVLVDVRRDGQSLQLTLPRGPLGFRSARVFPSGHY